MARKTTLLYEAVYYNGDGVPAYYTGEARNVLGLSPEDISDEEIQETIYVIRSDGFVSTHDLK